MANHAFNFDGGDHLSKIGATWFVSYAYYTHIDKNHMNWQRIKTHPNRISVFNRTGGFHRFWLERVLEMDDGRLNTATVGLKAGRTKEMVRELLGKIRS